MDALRLCDGLLDGRGGDEADVPRHRRVLGARALIRKALAEDGVSARIDKLVERLLG